MSPTLLAQCLFAFTGPTLVVCSVLIAFRRQYPPLLRFGPLGTVGMYFVAALVHFLVTGIAPLLIIPTGCFGLFLGIRFLQRSSPLAHLFAGCSLVFWPIVLFIFSQYLVLAYLHRSA